MDIEMSTDSSAYHLQKMGAPIYEYNPTPVDLNLEGSGKESFRAQTNSTDADFVSVTWAVEKSEGLIEWTIFHKINETNFFQLPDFPFCLRFDDRWFTRDDFKLKSIQSYHYENYGDYEDYLFARYGDGTGGEYLQILDGGQFEQKTKIY